MKILVKIDKAECFRQGFDAPKNEEVLLDLDPEMFKDSERDYIVDRMIDGKFQGTYVVIAELFKICPPSLDGFIDAVHRGMDAMKDECPY